MCICLNYASEGGFFAMTSESLWDYRKRWKEKARVAAANGPTGADFLPQPGKPETQPGADTCNPDKACDETGEPL